MEQEEILFSARSLDNAADLVDGFYSVATWGRK
jgi:hypothetical protein